jgi:uncharacterized membrane protein
MEAEHRKPIKIPATAITWLLIALFGVFFSAYAIQRHAAFRTHTADLGQMDLAIWNTAHGRFVQEIKGEEISTRLTDHFEPIFIPISLAFWLWDDVRAILILQAFALALGALPAYWLARDMLQAPLSSTGRGAGGESSELFALAFAAVYLLAPALQAAALADFHAAPFAAAPLLFAFYYARRGEFRKMWLPALLVMAVKEEMSLLTLMLAGYIALSGRRRTVAALLAALSLGWFGLATFVLIPHYSAAYYGAEQSLYFQRYGELGNGPGDILRSLLSRPALVFSIVSQPERVRYLGGLLAAFGFLPLLAPEMLLLGAPLLAANLLSSYFAMYSGEFHYSAPLVPAFTIAAIYGAARLGKLTNRRAIYLPLSLLIIPLVYNYLYGFSPWSVQFDWPPVTAHQRLLARFAAQIPPDAPLSTTPPLNPHFSHRQLIYTFPALGAAEYVLLDVSGTTDMHPNDVYERQQELLRSGFCIRDAADGYVLLARSGPCLEAMPDEFYDFARAYLRQPQYPLALEFGNRLRCLGYDLLDDPKWRMTRLRLYWQVKGQALERDYRLYPFFFDDEGQIIADSVTLPLVETIWYPPSRWRGDEVVTTSTLPWNLGERFNIGLGVLDGGDWNERERRLPITAPQRQAQDDTWALLGAFQRRGRPLLPAEPFYAKGPAREVEAHFAGGIDLLGYDLAPAADVGRIAAGEVLTLTLHWQAAKLPGEDYTVFVHLVGPGGQRIAQDDAQPWELGPAPTSSWQPGRLVRDRHTLQLSDDAPPGEYELLVGLYRRPTGERLEVLDDGGQAVGDSVPLMKVRVE